MHYVQALPGDARHLHTSRYSMRWSDMDAFGHVNNATYFTFFEQARVDWLASLGEAHELVLANVSCTFFRPLVYPGDIQVDLFAGRVGRSSLESFYKVRRVDQPERLCTLGHGTIVWFDHRAGASVEIPEAVRRELAGPGARGR
jgi:acyl-CoA thioester hydrolase